METIDSKTYWKNREEENLRSNLKEEEEYVKEINRIYDRMMVQITKEINDFYVKYAKKEGITISEAKKRVKKLDINAYAEKAKKYVKEKDFSDEANEEMRLYNATIKINRLELLKANIGLELVDGFDELQKYYDQILTERTLEEFDRQAGILGKTILNNAEAAHAIVNASFANAKFSDRIWMYQDMLKADLSKLLREGLIQGRNPRQLATHLTKRFGVAKSNAERLMRTELARVQIEAQKQSFERNGYDQYEFIALGSACGICKELDGKHFKVKDMMPGENAPPMHPNCRCSTAAWMDRDEFDEWLERQPVVKELESDLGKFVSDMVSGLAKQRNSLKKGLNSVENDGVRVLLNQALDRVELKRATGRRSKYSSKENTVYLAEKAAADTLAHELFHEIDFTYRLTASGLLRKSVLSDYKRLQNRAKGYGKTIEEMLYSKYPEAFAGDGKIRFRQAYRAVSDIINGMSGGEINMGFWHDKEYWKIDGKLEAETFAQIGRVLYESDNQVLDMLKDIFPNSYYEVMETIERMIK